MQIGVLNNLRAGRSGTQVSRILSALKTYPQVHHVETSSARALPEAIGELARQDLDLLFINGGDGTLQFALTEMLSGDEFDRLPLIAPMRGGRTNMTALDLGAHRDPMRGMLNALRAAENGTLDDLIVDRPVLRIEAMRAREVHYGMFFGAGMIQRAIGLTHRLFPTGRSQGVLGAGIVTAGLVAKACLSRKEGVLTPDKAQIVLDDEMVPQGEFLLAIASSLDRLFLRMNPFWGNEKGGVRFTAIASHCERTWSAAPGILRGAPKPFVTTENGFTSRNAETAQMRLDCGFTVDGEIFGPRSDEVVTLTADRRLRFVRA